MADREKYRVFTNDLGPDAFSGYMDLKASNLLEAKAEALRHTAALTCGGNRGVGFFETWPLKVLVIPHFRRELWPDGETGEIPEGARPFFARNKIPK